MEPSDTAPGNPAPRGIPGPGDTAAPSKGHRGTRWETSPGAGGAGDLARLGAYEIISELGRGGMGVVYKAMHPGLKRTVALKVLIAGEDASDEAIARFHREAEAVAKLGHHPHIVPVYDIGREGRNHYFAMHFVEGRPLDRLIDEGEITPKRAALLAKKVAEALQHAHDRGVLHRDVKPANILVTPEGEPQLTDFGLARDVAAESRMTRSGMIMGTPNYMPPEQAEGRLAEVDERSDVYSLGATLYEMLTSSPPFDGDSAAAVIRGVLLDEPRSPRKANPGVDRDIETICLKCLEKERSRRYHSAGALASDLERYLEGRPLEARPISWSARMVRRARRNRAATAAFIAAILAIGAGATVGAVALRAWFGERARTDFERREKEAAQTDRVVAESDRDEAERMLVKGRSASRVLLAASIGLRKAHSEVRRAKWNPRLEAAARQAVFERRREDIESFLRDNSADSAARATAEAVKGWLEWQGGFEDRARSSFEVSRKADRDVPYADLFEASVFVFRYCWEMRLPRLVIGDGYLGIKEPPAETERMKALADELERCIARLSKAKLWGEESSAELREALDGFALLARGDYTGAVPKLDRALKIAELGWLDAIIRVSRGHALHLLRRFGAAEADFRTVLEEIPEASTVWMNLGGVLRAAAHEAALAGRDPEPLFESSLEALGKAARQIRAAAFEEACVRLAAAEWRGTRGEDLEPALRRAVNDFSSMLGDPHLRTLALDRRGVARGKLGSLSARHGKDADEWFRLAIADFDAALAIAPSMSYTRLERGLARGSLALIHSTKGEYSAEDWKAALKDCDQAVEDAATRTFALSQRSAVRCNAGIAGALAGEDPVSLFRGAAADASEAMGLDPSFHLPRLQRGIILLSWYQHCRDSGTVQEVKTEQVMDDLGVAVSAGSLPMARAWRARASLEFANDARMSGGDVGRLIETGLLDCKEALALNPRDDIALAMRAGLMLVQKQIGQVPPDRVLPFLREIEKTATLALGINGASVDALAFRALALQYLSGSGELSAAETTDAIEKARRDFSEAGRLSPLNSVVALNRARFLAGSAISLSEQGEDPWPSFREAEKICTDWLARRPQNIEFLAARAFVLETAARFELDNGRDPSRWSNRAVADLGAALDRDPSKKEFWRELGHAQMTLAEHAMAAGADAMPSLVASERAFSKAIDLAPGSPDDHFQRGVARTHQSEILRASGQEWKTLCGKGDEDFTESLKNRPDWREAWTNRGIIRMYLAAASSSIGSNRVGRYALALEDLRAALALSPGFQMAIQPALWVYRIIERQADAAAMLKAAGAAGLRIDPRGLSMLEALGRGPEWARRLDSGTYCAFVGDYPEARRLFDRGFADAADPGDYAWLLPVAHYNAACLAAAASIGREFAWDRPKPLNPETAAGFRGQALDHIRRAFGSGWRNFEEARTDPDLAALREHPQFEALIAELKSMAAREK